MEPNTRMFYHLLPEDLHEIAKYESHHSTREKQKHYISAAEGLVASMYCLIPADLAVSLEHVPSWVPSPGPRVYPCRKFQGSTQKVCYEREQKFLGASTVMSFAAWFVAEG